MFLKLWFEWIYVAKIVEARSNANKTENLEEMIELIDFMDKKIDEFKETYMRLKQKQALKIAEPPKQNESIPNKKSIKADKKEKAEKEEVKDSWEDEEYESEESEDEEEEKKQ